MKLNRENLSKISDILISAGQGLDSNASGVNVGKAFLPKGGDKEDSNEAEKDTTPPPKEEPKGRQRDKSKDEAAGLTKEQKEILDRDEQLGYCSGEQQELYFKRFNNGEKIVFDE